MTTLEKARPILIFVDSVKGAQAALEIPNAIILAASPSAQNVLAKKNLDFTAYLKLLPNVNEVKKMVKTANKFAISWYIGTPMEQMLKEGDVNLAYYLIGYWTNLLIIFLLSRFVIKKGIKMYDPKEILSAPSSQSPEYALNTDNFILETCSQNIAVNIPVKTLFDRPSESKIKFNFPVTRKLTHLMILIPSLLKRIGLIRPSIKNAVVLLYGDAHILTNSIALIKTLRRHFTVQVMGSRLSLEQRLQMIRAGIPFEIFEDLVKPTDSGDKVKKIINGWEKFSSSPQYDQLLIKFGLQDLKNAVTMGFNTYFTNHLKNVFLTLDQTKNLLATISPKATVLFGNYGKKGLSLSYATQMIGGKVFNIEHGIVPNPIQIHPPVYDYMLFWGDWSRRSFYRAFGEKLNKLQVVGWYLTDEITREMADWRKAAKELPNKKIKELTILILTTYPAYDFPKQLKIILDIAKVLGRMGIAELIIRPHPGEEMPHDLAWPKSGLKISWGDKEDLDHLIKRSDLVISEGTSVALRVMLWGKPLVHLVAERFIDFTNFSKHGAAVKLDDVNKLQKSIELLSQSQSARRKMLAGQKKIITDFCYKVDSRGSERIAKLIETQVHALP